MKRSDVRTAYFEYGARTSENVRQLSFAALGAIWLFQPPSDLRLSRTLVAAGLLAVLALAFDFLQSLYGTAAWGIFHRRKEREGLDDERQFKAPPQINWPTNSLFTLKVISLVLCYAFLVRHLAGLIQVF